MYPWTIFAVDGFKRINDDKRLIFKRLIGKCTVEKFNEQWTQSESPLAVTHTQIPLLCRLFAHLPLTGKYIQLICRNSHCASFYLSTTFRLNRKLTVAISWIELAKCEWSVQLTQMQMYRILSIYKLYTYFNDMDFSFLWQRTETPQANRIIECEICDKMYESLKSNHEISCLIQENIFSLPFDLSLHDTYIAKLHKLL